MAPWLPLGTFRPAAAEARKSGNTFWSSSVQTEGVTHFFVLVNQLSWLLVILAGQERTGRPIEVVNRKGKNNHSKVSLSPRPSLRC